MKNKIAFISILIILIISAFISVTADFVEKRIVEAQSLKSSENAVGDYGDCVVAGCSRQLCIDEKDAPNIFTSCEFLPEYECYNNAVCERGDNGKCGWRRTDELNQCIENANKSVKDVGM